MKHSDLEVSKIKVLIKSIENICMDTRIDIELGNINIVDVDDKLKYVYNYLEEIKNIADSCTKVTEED